MYNDTIKLLNLEQFNLKIKSLETTKKNNIIYCYITLLNTTSMCPYCRSQNIIVKEYDNIYLGPIEIRKMKTHWPKMK